MKASIILIVLSTLLFYSCGGSKTQTAIPGTYVTQFQNEYYNSEDTLIISEIGSSNTTFNIERKTGFKKISDGSHAIKKFKETKWSSSYDSDNHLLKETDLGRQIYLYPEKHVVKLGDSEYQKVK